MVEPGIYYIMIEGQNSYDRGIYELKVSCSAISMEPSSVPSITSSPSEKCYSITFQTVDSGLSSPWSYAESHGLFEIEGYGYIPRKCHMTRGASCTIALCGMKTMKLWAITSDGWGFTITGDIGALLDYNTVGSIHYAPFPTFVDGDEGDNYQEYELKYASVH